MTKHAKLTKPYTANHHVIGVGVQSNKVYLPLLRSRVVGGIAPQQTNAIR